MENLFDWMYYVNNNRDLRKAGINTKQKALEHWKNHGKYEGRKSHNEFISKYGYWTSSNIIDEHIFDPQLCDELVFFFKNKKLKIVDLGCGLGKYVSELNNKNIDCDGFDGNPNTNSLTNNLCYAQNLSIPFQFDKKYDWVISLEVGEHIPKEFESIFIENLHNNNTKGIILSWALPNQPGYGHFNCQKNEYIKKKFIEKGYVNDIELESTLRNKCKLKWFKETIMVFKKIIFA